MHNIEPFYNWRHLYIAEEDENSPFYGREHSELQYTNTIYNYYIHPQWDDFGSGTLYLKTLYCDYESSFAIIELMGEWNDTINNDIMMLKREVIDLMITNGIKKFILVGENVLNFHGSDDCYYEEWFDDVEDGWIVAINFREHVLTELSHYNIDYYLVYGGELNLMNWRSFSPNQLFMHVDHIVNHRLS